MGRGLRLALIALALFSITEANPYQKDEHPFRKLKVAQPISGKIEPRAPEDYRLPDSLTPSFQEITLQPEFSTRLIYGSTEIRFTCNIATSAITLNADDITFDEPSIVVTDLTDSSVISIGGYTDEQVSFGLWTATLTQPLEATKDYSITMNFTSTLNTAYDGMFLASYDRGGVITQYAATQYESTGARNSFPCFDEPGMKAVFRSNIIRPDNLESRSNMPATAIGQDVGITGYKMDSYQDSKVMSSYQNSYLISDFATAVDGIYTVNAVGDVIGYSDYPLLATRASTEYFGTYFDEVYPLPKLGSNALPEFFSGAMENYGLMNYLSIYLLDNPLVTTPGLKQVICEIVGHEVAHNWFGNLITVTWWDYIWTQESVTEFYAYKGCAAASPDMLSEINFISGTMQSALNGDDSSASHAMLFNLTGGDENSVFDGITYNKGSSVVRSFEYIATEPTMQRAMINYLNKYPYQNTNDDDFYAEIDSQAVADGWGYPFAFSTAMRTFTDQKNYPLLTVSRDAATGDATITQSVYLGGNTPLPGQDYRWYVPITTHTSVDDPAASMVIQTWMTDTDDSVVVSGPIPGNGDYFIVNKFHAVFCRVNYDADGWSDNIDALDADTFNIPPENRIQLMADAFTFAGVGILDYTTAFATTNYLRNENVYSALRYGMNQNFDIAMLLRSNTTIEPVLSAHMIKLMEPSYLRVRFPDSVSHPYGDQRVRSLSTGWLCHYSHAQCLQDTNGLFNVWAADTSDLTVITPNMKRSVLCGGAAQGDTATAQTLLDTYTAATIEEETEYALYGMTCLRDNAAINFFLDELFRAAGSTAVIPLADVSGAMDDMSVNPVGEGAAWTYIQSNYPAIATAVGDTVAEASVANIAQYFSTDERLAEMQAFEASYTFTTNAITGAITTINDNIAWNAANGDSIYNYMQSV